MISADSTGYATLDMLRRRKATDPANYALRFARALNGMALEYVPLPRALDYLGEAEFVVTELLDSHGAAPDRVHHLVMILANQAQCAAFSGEAGWSNLSLALDAAMAAVQWQREQLARHGSADPEVLRGERGVLAEVLLLLSRVQAACALLDDAEAAFREAEAIVRAEELVVTWGDALRTVGTEVGVNLDEWGGPIASDDRVRCWYWYQPV